MEGVLRGAFEGEFPLPNLTKLLDTVGRWFTSATLGQEDRVRLARLVRVASFVGPAVLAAKDRADFDDQMDRISRLPRFYDEVESLLLSGRSSSVETAPPAFDTGQAAADRAALFIEALGSGSLIPLVRGFQYLLVIEQAIARFEPKPNGDQEMGSFFQRSKSEPLWFLTDPKTSAEVARTMRHFLDLLIGLLSMASVFLGTTKVEPWLALALAERFQTDVYAVLRFVASLPGTDVPDDLVPVTDRFDLRRAEANAERARQRADRLFEEAARSSEPIWPRLSKPEDA